jgi:hypothetical protein
MRQPYAQRLFELFVKDNSTRFLKRLFAPGTPISRLAG